MSLIDPKKTIEVIQSRDFTFKKSFGQNFLIDYHVLDKIIDAADIGEEDYVLEIGPGIGTLTEALAARARKVIAVEIDDKLIPILTENLSGFDNIEIVHNDILKVDIDELIKSSCEGHPVKVVANLPYYITTPIIMELLERRVPMISATVMVQKEVADRMKAGPGTKDYGALSLAVQYYAAVSQEAFVPPNCFIPRPKVGSAVVKLAIHDEPPVKARDEKLLFDVIRGAFEQRRKTLVNALANYAKLDFTKPEVAQALDAAELSEQIRGEALTLSQFAVLADDLAAVRDNR